MGGYFAPRAVAYEKRITAVIANSLMPDLKADFHGRIGRPRSGRALWRRHFEDKVDLSEPMKKYMATTFKDRCGMAGQSLAAFCDNLGTLQLGRT